MGVDLHVHTTVSDGTVNPTECIKRAVSLGLEAISITDHDTVEGLEEATQEALKHPGFTFIPGIELSSDYFGTEVHILGYYIDYKEKGLRDFIQEMKLDREERSKKIIKKLNALGINIIYEDLKNNRKGCTIGRAHIAQRIVKLGYATNIQSAFDKYLIKGQLAYVPRNKITPVQAIEVINQARGLPVLAHPIFLEDKNQITNVLGQGFIGVEVEYPNQSKKFKSWLKLKAQEMELIATGGSDFHGDLKETQLGESTVEFSVVKDLQKLKGERNNAIFKKD